MIFGKIRASWRRPERWRRRKGDHLRREHQEQYRSVARATGIFSGDFPCSTLVEVRSLATPEILVEIEAIAVSVPANGKAGDN